MENAFLAALIMQAAEHRLKAEQLRAMIDESDPWWQHFRVYRHNIEQQASEHEALAEVYDRFAAPFIRDAVGEYVEGELARLVGPVELGIDQSVFELAPRYTPSAWQYQYFWDAYLAAQIARPLPLVITGIS